MKPFVILFVFLCEKYILYYLYLRWNECKIQYEHLERLHDSSFVLRLIRPQTYERAKHFGYAIITRIEQYVHVNL